MHDSEGEEGEEESGRVQEGPDYVQDPHSHRPPRVKSAKAGGEEMNSAIQSIKDLRQSLASTAANSNLSPTAGYVFIFSPSKDLLFFISQTLFLL